MKKYQVFIKTANNKDLQLYGAYNTIKECNQQLDFACMFNLDRITYSHIVTKKNGKEVTIHRCVYCN